MKVVEVILVVMGVGLTSYSWWCAGHESGYKEGHEEGYRIGKKKGRVDANKIKQTL